MRRTKSVSFQTGRDKGKIFTITEMDAFSCEDWARNAVSAVYRCAVPSDQGILSLIASNIRDAFTQTEGVLVELPSDGSLTRESPEILQTEADLKAAKDEEKREARESAPTQMAAILGLRLFMQLPAAEQLSALRPLLQCVTMEIKGKDVPVHEGGSVTAAARAFIEDPTTILRLQAEAFRMHTDFFTPAVASIFDAMTAIRGQYSPEPQTSPEPSPQP